MSSKVHPTYARYAFLAVISAALVLVFAAPASADYEQVGNFAQSGEAEQLEFALGMAVNINGAGGVPAGSLYVVGRNARVVRYSPGHEGEEPAFQEAWGWGVVNSEAGEFQRCGPALLTACAALPVSGIAGFGGEEVGHFNTPAGVAVDQATGDVYVLNTPSTGYREQNLIEVFSATGTPIGRFGDAGAAAESITEGPEKLHSVTTRESGIAVDDTGRVYLPDEDFNAPAEARVLCFEPQSPGDYAHYVYCGRSEDIKLGAIENNFSSVAVDDFGHLYGVTGVSIEELSLAEPAAAPICSYSGHGTGISFEAMAVNPVTGEVFYVSEKNRNVHRFGPCNPATGGFEEVQEAVKPEPETQELRALTVDPVLVWGSERTPGVLYGADGENHFKEVPPHHGVGDVFAPAVEHAPTIEAESVSSTGTTSSVLGAGINPRGFVTHYVFQYLSEAEYEANAPAERFAGATEVPFGGGQIGGGAKAQAGAAVSGLVPGGEYRFRVIATSECGGASKPVCQTVGEAAAFSTYPAEAPGLPDDRAYELVSPIQKNGGEVIPAAPEFSSCIVECKPGATAPRFPMQSSPDGEAVVYQGFPFSLDEGAPVFDEYLSRRTASGWQTTVLSPPQQGDQDVGHIAFDPQLDKSLLQVGSQLVPGIPAGVADLYGQSTAAPSSSLTPLLTTAPPNRTSGEFKLEYAGRSSDLSRIFFTANDALTGETAFAPEPPDPTAAKSDLYEWSARELRLVNVLPGNTTVATGAAIASKSPDTHAVSTDGSRVFWNDGAGHLYVRENDESTVQVSASSPSATFLTASADGSEVLLSNGCLYDVGSETCEDLTKGHGAFQGIAGVGEEHGQISHVYFVDTGVLTGEEKNAQGAKAQTGQDNLYSWNEGATVFVATLLTSDNSGNVAGRSVNDWNASPIKRTAEASPDGRYLAFSSKAELTGYGNVGPACEENSVHEFVTVPCAEIFLYDSLTGVLHCASCNPTGEAPIGRSTLRLFEDAHEWLPQARYLTDTGRLFFDSSDALSPFDTNHGVEDVYEYEPAGAGKTGTCERAAGCVSLISTGHGSSDSNFLAADESGANVFFTTRDQLVSSDKDESVDVYDAREDGGFANESEQGSGNGCEGEACQLTPSSPGPGGEPSASSSFFFGAGNLSSPTPLGIAPPAKKAKVKALTGAQKLASALKACRRKSGKARSSCEKTARKRYAPNTKAKKGTANNRKGGR